MRAFTLIGCAILVLGLAASAWALEEAGRVTELRGSVQATHSNGQMEALKPNAAVYIGDKIATGPTGRVRILFLDDSVLTLSAKTRIEINQLVYKPKENLRSSVFSLFEGTLKAAVGGWFSDSTSETQWQLRTPTAVAGVRGTSLVGQVNSNGSSTFTGLSGLVSVTALVDANGKIVMLQPNFFTVVKPGGVPSNPTLLDAAALQALLESLLFPENPLDPWDDSVWESQGLHETQIFLTPEALALLMAAITDQTGNYDNPADWVFQEPPAMTSVSIHIKLP